MKEDENKVMVITPEQELFDAISKPDFTHKEVEWLYENDLYFPGEKIDALLELPKETLANDLEMVLLDSINRYKYFSNLVNDRDYYADEELSFLVHALFLLGELKAGSKIDAVFKVLSQSETLLEFYLGDLLTETLWEPFYKIANQNTEACRQFLLRPGICTQSRAVVLQAIEQIAYHQPERRTEVTHWFKAIMTSYLESHPNDNVVDSDTNGLLISGLMNLNTHELMPEIEQMFNAQMVSEEICGDLAEVKHAFVILPTFNYKRELLSVSERYKEIYTTWGGFKDSQTDETPFADELSPRSITAKADRKIGRNEPCPCGSGKKYKQCCLKYFS